MPWFVLCTAVAALYLGREFLAPLALAVFMAFVFAPLVRSITHRRVPRAVATTLVLGGFAVVVFAIGWMFVSQARSFADHLPDYRSNLRSKIADVRATYGNSFERASTTVRELGDQLTPDRGPSAPAAPAEPADVFSMATVGQGVVGSIALFGTMAAFVFVLAWVMLLRWEDLRDRVLELAGRSELYVTTRATTEASAAVTAYIRKQLLVNTLHGTAVALVLAWIEVPNPVVWGFFAGIARFVPYLGPIVATLAPIAVSLASSVGWAQTWTTAAALVTLELVTANVVEPLLYGAVTGVSPLAILVSAAFWTWIWGPVGLVLSTPLTVCLLVIGRHFPRLHFLEVLMGDQPAMPEHSRLYQRLLAGDPDEAWEILRGAAAKEGDLAAADRLLLPALALAGQAVRDGLIDADHRERIGALSHTLVTELEESRDAAKPPADADAPFILCLPARDGFDAVGSRLLANELAQRGLPVALSGDGELLAETLSRIQESPPRVVCVSSVTPTHFLQVRSLCKRLLQVDDEMQIVLGLWGETLDRAGLEQRLPSSPRIHVVRSLAEAAAAVVPFASRSVAANAV
jgi:predicted PurR-regulated permease PerM